MMNLSRLLTYLGRHGAGWGCNALAVFWSLHQARRPLTTREISMVTALPSITEIGRILYNLVEAGLVTKKPCLEQPAGGNSRYVYRVSKQGKKLLFDAISAALTTPTLARDEVPPQKEEVTHG